MFPYLPLQRSPDTGVAPPLTCIPDPYYDGASGFSPHTVLSLHGEAIVDSSSDPKTLTNSGVTVSTAQEQFGASSLYFNGSARLSTSQIADFDFSTGDFTLETWVYPLATTAQRIIVRSTSGGVYPFSLAISGSSKFAFFCCDSGSAVVTISSTTTVTTGRWWHMLAVRSGSNFYLFVDGVLEGSAVFAGTLVENGVDVSIGAYALGAEPFYGYIDDLRITRGVARETPTFSVPTAAFPDAAPADPYFANVVLLLHLDGADGGTTFTDSSSYAKTPTSSVGVTTSVTQYKFGGSSGRFVSTGSQDSLRFASSTDFDLSGDFTMECWAYFSPLDGSGFARMIACRRAYNTIGAGTFRWGRGGWQSLVSGAVQIVATTEPTGEWIHTAISRRNGVMRAFINGELQASGADTTDYTNANELVIGHDYDAAGASTPYGGYIEDFRITKGVGRYVDSFAPPTLTFCDSEAGAGGDTTPIPTPIPPPSPIVFTVAAVSPVDFTISTLISPARTLATITTAETSVAILASASVPGVTFNVVGSPVTSITATGTPTTAGQTRVVLTYVRNDGSGLVLGSSTHTINVIDPSILFVAGANANYSGRAGVPVNVTLCSPSIALNVDVLAFPNVTVPGCTVTLDWTPGGTSTGVLTLAGTPTTVGTYSLTVTYYALGRIAGTSAHTITIAAAWTPPPPAPAPAPAPTPPTPAPVPSPPPAPAPGPLPGADPLFSSVLLLHRFNASDVVEEVQNHRGDGPVTGGGEVLTITRNFVGMRPEDGQRIIEVTDIRPRPYRGNSILPGQFTRVLNVCTMNNGPIADLVGTADAYFTYREPLRYTGVVGPSLSGRMISAAGASGEAAGFDGGAGLRCDATAAMGAATTALTVECYVTADDATGLWAGGSGSRYTPLVSCVNPGNQLVWTLGLWSFEDGYSGRVVTAVMWRATTGTPSYSISPQSSIASAPGGFLHIAGQWSVAGALGCWWAGEGGAIVDSLSPGTAGRPVQAGAYLVVGGSCPPPQALNMPWTIKPLVGRMDELRITAAQRYSLAGTGPAPLLLTVTEAITAAQRAIPFASY